MEEIDQVALVPFIKVETVPIADLSFWNPPFVESLSHNKKSHSVAEIEKLRCEWIVAGADGIAAHFLEDFQSTLPNTKRNRGTNAARFVVDACAVQLYLLTIEQKAAFGVENGFANAEGRVVDI